MAWMAWMAPTSRTAVLAVMMPTGRTPTGRTLTAPTLTGPTRMGPMSPTAVLAAMPTAPTGSALRRCVGDPERFVREQWTCAPLHRRRNSPDGFADLFKIADVDHLVAAASLRIPALRMVKDGE